MNEVPELAPGCFGSALNFNKGGMVCSACPFMEKCEPAHENSLNVMRERFGISAPKKKVEKVQPVEKGSDERLSLPKKVKELLGRLDKENLNIVGNIQNGVNPFSGMKKYGFMLIACHIIMRSKNPVDQRLISTALVRSLNWSQGTADAHARMSIQALKHVGAITNENGIIQVRNQEK